MSDAAHPLWNSIQNSIDSHGSRIAASNGLSDAISYTELGERTAALADALRENNIKPGDRVAVCLPKDVGMLIAMLGILRLGAAYVPVNPADPPARNAAIIEACSASAILGDATLVQKLYPNAQPLKIPGAFYPAGNRSLTAGKRASRSCLPAAHIRFLGPAQGRDDERSGRDQFH